VQDAVASKAMAFAIDHAGPSYKGSWKHQGVAGEDDTTQDTSAGETATLPLTAENLAAVERSQRPLDWASTVSEPGEGIADE
jgi:hypothetical protein